MDCSRKIIHIDMDAFFASVEQHDSPSLLGKPVIVGGDPTRRGVVAACSYEARRFGIHSAMPSHKAKKLCPHAIFIRPRMYRYKEISKIIMDIFKQHTSAVEPLSVDEAFLDVTSSPAPSGSATLLARQICAEIKRKTNLTASAGISYNKFLAKVASDLNKPNGVATIPPDQAIAFINTLPVQKFYGVGKVTREKMNNMGIYTGKDLSRYSKESLINHFGKAGAFFYNICKGEDTRPVLSHRTRKSFGKETTLNEDTSSVRELRLILRGIIEELGDILSRSRLGAYTVTVKIRYNDFTTITRSSTSQHPLRNSEHLLQAIPTILAHCDFSGKPIRLIGVSVCKLIDLYNCPWQPPLPFPESKNRSSWQW